MKTPSRNEANRYNHNALQGMQKKTLAGYLVAGLLVLQGCADAPSFVERAESSKSNISGSDASRGELPVDSEENPAPIPDAAGDPSDGVGPDGSGSGTGGTDTNGSGPSDGNANGGGSNPEPPEQPLTNLLEVSFNAADIDRGSLSWELASADLEQTLTMRRNVTSRTRTASQVVRRRMTERFAQGNTGIPVTERMTQAESRPLDVVVVVDNSQSMTEEQTNLAGKLAPLLSYVESADWQIGVVTTDPAGGCLRRLIRKGDSNAQQAFSDAVRAGVNGSSTERGILQAVNALSGSCLAQPWLRSDSTVAVLIVSDEDNCSNGSGCGNNPFASGSYLTDWLAGVRQPGVNARVYGLIWHPSVPQTSCSTALNPANIYADVIAQTNGTWGSICDADYSATLSAMSQNISGVLRRSFTLRETPDANTLRVWHGTTELTRGWTITGKVVTFETPPVDGAELTFEYSWGARPVVREFALSETPLEGSLNVNVNGSPSSDWVWDSNTRSVIFDMPPPERASIEMRWTENRALATDFSLGENVRPGSLTVRVNGSVVESGWNLLMPASIVRFDAAPAEGANLRFEFMAIGDPVLAYPFSPAGGQAQDLRVVDMTSGRSVSAFWLAGLLTFPPGEWSENRQVRILWRNPARDSFTVELPHDPVGGRVVATAAGSTCDLTSSGRTVRVQGCSFAADVSTIDLNYEHITAQHSEFVVTNTEVPAPEVRQVWTVFVDGQAVQGWTRRETRIEFASPPPARSVVKVRVQW